MFDIVPSHMIKLSKATEYADLMHKDQKYDQFPYTMHLQMTIDKALEHEPWCPEDLLAACALHDILEDTTATSKDLKDIGMSELTIRIVEAVTDPPGKNRKERKKLAYRQIKGFKEAVFVKLCDRIANVSWNKNNSSLRQMYQREHTDFEAELRVQGEFDDMWEYLAQLLHNSWKFVIEEVFDITGRGTVVVGRFTCGHFLTQDMGKPIKLTNSDGTLIFMDEVKGIEMYDRGMTLEPNDSQGLLLKSAKKSDIVKGMLLIKE